jgi:hypothetical protein
MTVSRPRQGDSWVDPLPSRSIKEQLGPPPHRIFLITEPDQIFPEGDAKAAFLVFMGVVMHHSYSGFVPAVDLESLDEGNFAGPEYTHVWDAAIDLAAGIVHDRAIKPVGETPKLLGGEEQRRAIAVYLVRDLFFEAFSNSPVDTLAWCLPLGMRLEGSPISGYGLAREIFPDLDAFLQKKEGGRSHYEILSKLFREFKWELYRSPPDLLVDYLLARMDGSDLAEALVPSFYPFPVERFMGDGLEVVGRAFRKISFMYHHEQGTIPGNPVEADMQKLMDVLLEVNYPVTTVQLLRMANMVGRNSTIKKLVEGGHLRRLGEGGHSFLITDDILERFDTIVSSKTTSWGSLELVQALGVDTHRYAFEILRSFEEAGLPIKQKTFRWKAERPADRTNCAQWGSEDFLRDETVLERVRNAVSSGLIDVPSISVALRLSSGSVSFQLRRLSEAGEVGSRTEGRRRNYFRLEGKN